MKGFFIAVVCLSFVGSAIISLSPSGYEKHLKSIASLGTLTLAVAMLFSFMGERENYLENFALLFSSDEYQKEVYDEIYNSSLIGAEKQNAEMLLKTYIIQDLSLNNDGFDVNIVVDSSSDAIYIKHVELIIYPDGITIDPKSVEKYIREKIGCECVVVYDL